MHDYEKPYYTIYQHSGCASEIFVNDIMVSSWLGPKTEGQVTGGGAIPINHAVLQSGKYKVIGKMYPRHGKETLTEEEYMKLDFELAEADLDKWKKSKIKFRPSIESPWDGLTEGIKYPYFEITTEIEVELPFVLDGWQNSMELTKIKEEKLFKEVFAFYTQLHAVVQSHNVSKFLELSKEKLALQEKAFYFSEERKKSFMDGAVSLFAKKLELLPLNPMDLKLVIMGYGKLVKLIRKDNTEAIQFKSPNPDEQSNIELETKIHMRNKKEGFRII